MNAIKKSIRHAYLLALFSLASWGAMSQSLSFHADIDSTRMLIGDQLNIWLRYEFPAGTQYRTQPIPDTLAGKIEVLRVDPADTIRRTKEMVSVRQRILITSFDTGFFVIPSFYLYDSQTGDSLKSNALPLEVFDMPIDTTKGIADIKMPYEIPLGWADLLPYLIALVLIAGAIAIYILIRKRKKTEPEPVKKFIPPPIPAHIWALDELDKLAAQKLWQQGKVKLYYSRITEIIRRYIEMRFGIQAMEETTYDIMRSFREGNHLAQENEDKLRIFLEEADLVKFAKYQPDADDNEKSFTVALDFVRATKIEIDLRSPDK